MSEPSSTKKALIGLGLAGGIAVGLGVWWWKRQKSNHQAIIPPEKLKPCVISEILVYPLKGAGGISLQSPGASWPLCETGLKYDREWVLLYAGDSTDPQSRIAKHSVVNINHTLMTIRCRPNWEKRILTFSTADDADSVSISLDHDTFDVSTDSPLVVSQLSASGDSGGLSDSMMLRQTSTLVLPEEGSVIESVNRYGTTCDVTVCSNEASKWFSRVLKLRVVLCRTQSHRMPHSNPKNQGSGALPTDKSNFQSFSHLHFVSEEGIEWLQNEVPRHAKDLAEPLHRLSAATFRANVVTRGAPFPQEDHWSEVHITPHSGIDSKTRKPVHLRFAKPCGRCIVPTCGSDGQPNKKFEPTRTLRKIRGAKYEWIQPQETAKREAMFGTEYFLDNYEPKREGGESMKIAVGDVVQCVKSRAPPRFLPHTEAQ